MAESLTNEDVPVRKRLGLRVARVWIVQSMNGDLAVYGKRPADRSAVEYMRVMTREEVEKLAEREDGVDTQQLLNSLIRTVEGQRIEINRLQEQLSALKDVAP